jgi:hypothetical protein
MKEKLCSGEIMGSSGLKGLYIKAEDPTSLKSLKYSSHAGKHDDLVCFL